MIISPDNLKKGDKIIVTESRNGAQENVELEILTRYNGYYNTINTAAPDKRKCYVYFAPSGTVDVFILADRDARKEYLSKQIEQKKEELKRMEDDLYILTNFDSDEAYVAYKLSEILKAKDDPKAIEKVLKELKVSHLL